ncbi:MAG: hypothetical protein Kow00108_01850 [Calditrichia bacterium]
MKKFFLVSFIILLAFITGCATILKGTKQEIPITSSPTNAMVEIEAFDGTTVFKGETPVTVSLLKKNRYTITIKMDGYEDAVIAIDKDFEPTTLGNIFCGGIIGVIIDFANGAAYKLSPEAIRVELVQATASIEDPNSTELYAVVSVKKDNGQVKSVAVPMIKN